MTVVCFRCRNHCLKPGCRCNVNYRPGPLEMMLKLKNTETKKGKLDYRALATGVALIGEWRYTSMPLFFFMRQMNLYSRSAPIL